MRTRHQPAPKFILLGALLVLAGCGGPVARTAHYIEKGRDYVAKGELEKARIEFRNALQISPNSGDVRYRNGLVEEKLGAYQRAAALYEGALDVDKTLDDARVHLAELYLFSGMADRVISTVEPGLALHPGNADLLAIRAAARGQRKEYEPAIADAEQALKLASGSELAIGTLAGLYSVNNRPAEAQALLEGARQKLPSSIGVRQALVKFYAEHEQGPKAEVVLKELVQIAPKEVPLRLDLAHFYAATNRDDDAEHVLRETVAAFPGSKQASGELLDFLKARRGPEASERELLAIIAAKPDDFDLQMTLGLLYEQQRQPDKATGLYQKIIADQGKRGPGLLARDRLAAQAIARGDLDAARKTLAEVLEANPRDSEALVMRSVMALNAGDAKNAIVDLRAVVRDQPNSVPLKRELARAYFANGDQRLGEDILRQAMDGNGADNTAATDMAEFYLRSGRASEARPIADELVRREPRNAQFRALQFRSDMTLKDLVAADVAVKALRSDHPDLPIGWYLGGLLEEAQGHDAEALRSYDKAVEVNGRSDEPLEAAVRLLLREKKVDAAFVRVDAVFKQYPDDAFAANLKAELYLGSNRLDEADSALQAAMQRSPGWWVPYRNLAYLRVARKDPQGALTTLRDAYAKLGDPEPLGQELAKMQQAQGQPEQAIATYERVLKKYPQSELVANNLAMLLVSGHPDKARLDRALELAGRFSTSRNPDFLDTNGWVLLQRGDANAALPVFEKALAIAPDSAVIRYHLAMAQYGAGQKQIALGNLQRALESNQRFDGLDDARARLLDWKKTS
jgi:tetratricopeptide (TPR) repeat protein